MRTKPLTTTMPMTLGIALLAAACGGGPASGSGASIVEDDPAEVEATDPADDAEADPDGATEDTDDGAKETDRSSDATEEEATADADEEALGTRDNPLPVGTRIEMGDWTLAVTEVTLDAAEQVMAENQFNDPPVEGRQFVLFSVGATYEGEDSGMAFVDFSWAVVGSAGNTFGTAMEDYCGVIPDSLDGTGETYPGGNVSGNVCVSVASDQVDGATIRIEETFSFDDTRAFYALN